MIEPWPVCNVPFACEGVPKQSSKMFRLRFVPSTYTYITPRASSLLRIVGGNLGKRSPTVLVFFGVHHVPMCGKVGSALGVNGVSVPGQTNL